MSPGEAIDSHAKHTRMAWLTLVFAIVCGAVLRLVWIEDMEWKHDEQWSYTMSQEVGRSRPWPWVGMPTSLNFPNPGLSVWTFVAIGRIATSPTAMARAIVILNMIGLIGFAGAVRVCLPASQREPWVWGLALQAVSPYAIRLSRKVWPPSILTPLLLILWVSHRYRLTRWGAFAWGLMSALIGQVHLSGWFVAIGLVIGTLAAEIFGRLPRSRFWHWWALGMVLGLLPAVPWAQSLPPSSLSLFTFSADFMRKGRIGGYLYGMVAATSSTLPYAFLGVGEDVDKFLAGPIVSGIYLHFYESIDILLFSVFLLRLGAHVRSAFAHLGRVTAGPELANDSGVPVSDDSGSPQTVDDPALIAACPSVTFYLWTTVAIPSVILFMATNVYFYHYYFVFCPFLFVLVAKWMLPWRRVLIGLVVAQALMSCIYLVYIHQNGGARRGEYGLTYTRQGNR